MKDLITTTHASRLSGYSRQHLNTLCRQGKVYGIPVGQPGPGWLSGKDGRLVYHNLISYASLEDYIVAKAVRKLRKVATIKLDNRVALAA